MSTLLLHPRRRRAYRMLVLTELRLAWRTPISLVIGIGLPVLLLIIFGSVPSLTQPKEEFGGVSFFTLYTPSILVLVIIMLGMLSLPPQMASYREQGVLHRMSTTPVPAHALLGAQLAVNIVFAVVSFALLLGVGAGAFELALPVQFGWLVLSLALAVAATFGIGLCVAAFAGSPRVANVIGGLLLYPLAFSSGIFGPIAEYPGVVGQIAKWMPTGAAYNAFHASLGGHFPGWVTLGVLVAYAVVFSAIAVRWFRWDIERSHARLGGSPALLTLTRSVTLRGEVTGEQVARTLRDGLPSRFEVRPATKFKGRLFGFGTEPAGPDVTTVTTGLSGLGRAEVTVIRASRGTRVRVRPGGHPLYSALGVAKKVRRVLRDLAEVSPPGSADPRSENVLSVSQQTSTPQHEMRRFRWPTAVGFGGLPVPVWVVAAVFVTGELALSGRYGFLSDELYFIEAGRHLAFGYVDMPPLAPLLTRITDLLGVNPTAIRILPALAGGAVVLVAARLAALFGAGRVGQVLAGLTTACAPLLFALAHLGITEVYDLVTWAAVLLFVSTALLRTRPRQWLAAGVAAGIGLQANNLMLLLLICLAVGLLVTEQRFVLRTRWPWLGAGIAALIWAPNVIWQATHGWPQVTMAGQLHRANSIPVLYALGAFGQLAYAGLLVIPLLVAGFVRLWRAKELRFRACQMVCVRRSTSLI